MSEILSINCFILGDPKDATFVVDIPAIQKVSKLKQAIQELDPIFRGVAARYITLCKALKGYDELKHLTKLPGPNLDPLDTIDDVFKDDCLNPKHIHVIIEPPLTEHEKRKRSPLGDDTVSRFKRSRIVTITPSTFAKPPSYRETQEDLEERILDDRPEADNIPPVSLLYDGYGQFFDIVAGNTEVDGLKDINTLELQLAVDEFAQSMCRLFNDENTKRDKGLDLLNKIFATKKDGSSVTLTAASIGRARTNGHYTGTHGMAIMIAEFKNSSAGNNAIPEVELIGYFAQSFAQGVEQLKGRRVPGLGITIIGPDIKFYAMLSLETQFRLVSLTPALSCVHSASEGQDRDALYRAFMAASVLRARIRKDVSRYQLFTVGSNNVRLPSVSKLRRWGKNSGEFKSGDFLEFKIQNQSGDPRRNQFLYLANTDTIHGEKTILIKFVRQYCPELHDICATSGHAPTLHAYERLPGGWYGVAMEYMAGAVPITLHNFMFISKHIEHWMSDLQSLVAKFHEKGFVHGDLRDTNIISGEDGCVELVDFDWGGKDGEAAYPTPNLTQELVDGRSPEDLKITKEDDRRILKNTLAKTLYLCSLLSQLQANSL